MAASACSRTFCGSECLCELFGCGRRLAVSERPGAVRLRAVGGLLLLDVSLQRVVSQRRRLGSLHHHLLDHRLKHRSIVSKLILSGTIDAELDNMLCIKT